MNTGAIISLSAVEGSEAWQWGLFAFGALIILACLFRGWRNGPARELVNLGALAGAYAAALYGGALLVPLLRGFVRLPDLLLRLCGGVAVGMVVYLVVRIAGLVLLKRTAHQESLPLRLVYGLSGAVIGLVLGLASVWLMAMGLRVAGTIAEAGLEQNAKEEQRIEKSRAPNATKVLEESRKAKSPILEITVRARKSMEMGRSKAVLDAVDVVPPEAYAILGDVARLAASVDAARRFMAYPGAAELAAHPAFEPLTRDPEILALARRGEYLTLIENPKVIAAANDADFASKLKRFELKKALDHALQRGAVPAPTPVPTSGPPKPRLR